MKSKVEYHINFGPEAARIVFTQNSRQFRTEEWDRLEKTPQKRRWLLIRELVDNGQALKNERDVEVPNEEVVRLGRPDRELLRLPETYPFDIRLDAKGALGQDEFEYEVGYYVHSDGEKLQLKRTGAILRSGSREFLLGKDQYALCEAISDFHDRPTEERDGLHAHAEIKELAEEAGASMDSHLEAETVVSPEKIEVDVEPDDEALVLAPRVPELDEGLSELSEPGTSADRADAVSGAKNTLGDGNASNGGDTSNRDANLDKQSLNEKLQERFDKFPRVLSRYTVERKGKKVRVAFDEKQQEALSTLKEHRRVEGEERDRLVDHPEAVLESGDLEEDVFDLDHFSERVIELGYQKERFYSFVSPKKSQWVPGVLVETSPEERERVTFGTEEELKGFEQSLQDAKEEGSEKVSWKGFEIPVSEGERLAEKARQQFEHPETPITELENGQTDQKEKAEGSESGSNNETEIEDELEGEASPNRDEKVLIIHTNLEEEEYSEAPSAPTTEDFDHAYEPPPDLKPKCSPYEHQKTGIGWMQSLARRQHPGALLADDMGLGKTLQVLSFMKWHWKNRNSAGKPYLVAAPVALLKTWASEYDKFFEQRTLSTRILRGKSLRKVVRGNVKAHYNEGAKWLADKGEICITTYDSMRRYELLFGAVEWGGVVLDEAQKIKNPTTRTTQAAKALQADFKLPITGTPVQNSLVDLWSIIDFAVPGLLGSAKEFAETYHDPSEMKILI